MERNRRRRKRVNYTPLLLVLAVVVISLVVGICLLVQMLSPRFQNVTIELGQAMPDMSAFYTKYADPEQVQVLFDPSLVDVSKVGDHYLSFCCGDREETVILEVRDTTAPEVVFRDASAYPGSAANAQEFIDTVYDLSEYTVSFVKQPEISREFGPLPVQIKVTDAHGNETIGDCTLHYTWLRDNVILELGQKLQISDLLLGGEKAPDGFDHSQIDAVNKGAAGQYQICAGDRVCKVTVRDTTAPELLLQDVTIFLDQQAQLRDFLVSVKDASGAVSTRILTELTFGAVGQQKVSVEAEDCYGNISYGEAVLTIKEDEAPEISGLEDIVLRKYAVPNYTAGIAAVDDRDGPVSFTYDTSKVQLDKAGTYFITYTAVDSAGNETTMRRRLIVESDSDDTAILIAQMAAQCGNDPKAITDFVRSKIYYRSDEWGGEDPAYFGFTKGYGNCMVSAACLQAILEYKGYNTKLIWLKEEFEPHYWVIVEVEPGVWRHVDATRGVHAPCNVVTDAERLKTLVRGGVQRIWDTSKWPACE